MTIDQVHAKRGVLAVGLAIAVTAVLSAILTTSRQVEAYTGDAASSTIMKVSYLYRFDPATQGFFTVTLTADTQPVGVAVTGTNPTHVWFTEYGADRIGHVVFTDTMNYTLVEHLVPPGSKPYLITLAGDQVWFTERGTDRVGRINALTGQLDEFFGHGLPAEAGLADLNVAPDGSLWLAGEAAKHLYRLVVTSTVDYAFDEYPTNPPTTFGPAGPYGIDVVVINPPDSYQIAFASPTSNSIGLLTPGSREVLLAASIAPGFAPTDIVYEAANDQVWFSEPGGNYLGQSFKSTLGGIPRQIPAGARPTFLSRKQGNTLWMSQQDPVGQLMRFVYTGTTDYAFTSYPLPVTGLQPNAVAVSDDQAVWTVAYRPARLFLPVVVKNMGS